MTKTKTKTLTLVATALGLTALASACTVDAALTEEEIASDEAALCDNPQATNAVMAAMAVAAANELRRWSPKTDLFWNNTTNRYEVTATGRARCGGTCRNLNALLTLQNDSAAGTMIGGSALSPDTLRSRLYAAQDAQRVCNSRPDNHQADNCPVEAHDLKFSSKAPGSCDTDFWYHAYKAGTTVALGYPTQLKNQLIWAGYPDNPYLAFDVQGDDVKIDPTGGLIEGDTTSSGSCTVGCTKYSATSLIGACCSCNGYTKKYVRSPFSYDYYLCK